MAATPENGAHNVSGDRAVSFTAKPSLIEAIGAEVLDEADPRAIAKSALTYLNRYLKTETSFVVFARGNNLVVAAALGPHVRRLARSKFPLTDVPLALVRGEKWALNLPDINERTIANDELTSKLAELECRSLLMVSLGRHGLIMLADPRIDSFNSFDEAGVVGVATQLEFILERIEREENLKVATGRLKDLLDSVTKAQSTGDLREALQSMLEAIVEHAGADSGSFLLGDGESGMLLLSAAVGLGPQAMSVEIAPGEGIAGWVATHKRSVNVTDLNGAEANGVGKRTISALSIPVTSGDKLIGVINLGSKQRQFDFNLAEIEHLTGASARLGAGLAAERRNDQWRELYFDTIRALTRVIESRNPFDIGHSAAVAERAAALGGALGLTLPQMETIEVAALLHDVGVAAFANDFLGQERPLNSAERLILRSHPSVGKNALSGIDDLRGVLPIILYHHENYDGTGYADGLEGESIPLGARILAVAEAYVAMTSERPYRGAMSAAQALTELKNGAGRQFDPKIIDTFVRLVEKESRSGKARG